MSCYCEEQLFYIYSILWHNLFTKYPMLIDDFNNHLVKDPECWHKHASLCKRVYSDVISLSVNV